MNQKHIFKKSAIVGVASLTLSAVSINTTTQIAIPPFQKQSLDDKPHQ